MSQAKKSIDPVSFQKRLNTEIPLSTALQIEVKRVEELGVELTAPLAPNINHKGSAFGGSANSVAVAACWSLITGFVELEQIPCDFIVIADSQMDYIKPIKSDFRAIAEWESDAEREKFVQTLRRKGRARAHLMARLSTPEDGICAEFHGRFVAQMIGR